MPAREKNIKTNAQAAVEIIERMAYEEDVKKDMKVSKMTALGRGLDTLIAGASKIVGHPKIHQASLGFV
jgi:hypothetical protein